MQLCHNAAQGNNDVWHKTALHILYYQILRQLMHMSVLATLI